MWNREGNWDGLRHKVNRRSLLLSLEQVHEEQLLHALRGELVLPHVLSKLCSVGVHQSQSLVVHILLDKLIVVDDSLPLIKVLVHHSCPGGHLADHAPVLQIDVPKMHQSLLRHRGSPRGLLLRRREPLELSLLLHAHALHVLPLNSIQVLHVGSHRLLLLPLVRQHLMHHAHVRSRSARLASSLLDLHLLTGVLRPALLRLIQVLLVPPELTDFWSVPEPNESPVRESDFIILLDDPLCDRKGRDLAHPSCHLLIAPAAAFAGQRHHGVLLEPEYFRDRQASWLLAR